MTQNIIGLPDLKEEFGAAVTNLGGYAQLQLARAGIDISVQEKLPFGRIGFMKVQIDGDYFTPVQRHGTPVFVAVTAILPGGIIEDLVAFTPDDPKRWWLRTGDGEFLGNPFGPTRHIDICRFLKDGANGYVALQECHVG
jgi:hypothetical protein